MDFWQNVQTFGATMAVQSGALVVGSRRIVVLHGKQEPLSKDIKRKCSLHFKATIPRISILLACYWVFCIEKYMRRLVTAGVSPHRDGRYSAQIAQTATLLLITLNNLGRGPHIFECRGSEETGIAGM
jgi:hypothetical protein